MKLFLLRPIGYHDEWHETGPWNPWYDKVFGHVVRAPDEQTARRIADEHAGDENRDRSLRERHPWLDPEISACVELTADGEPGHIIYDHRGA